MLHSPLFRALLWLLCFCAALPALADGFVWPQAQLNDAPAKRFTSDDPNLALHRHGGAGNAAIRDTYLAAETAFPTAQTCLTPQGHPSDGYDLTRIDWDRLTTPAKQEVCFFRLLTALPQSEWQSYLTAISFDSFQIVPGISQTLSYNPPVTRDITVISAGVQRDRSLGRKVPIQSVFQGSLFHHSATLHLEVHNSQIVLVAFGLNLN